MKREDKKKFIADFNADLKASDLVIISYYDGLTVAQMSKLRAEVRKAGGKLQVAKNRLAKLALEGTNHKDIGAHLKGPTVIAYTQANGSFGMLKAAVDFAKDNANLRILGGAFEGKVMSVDTIKAYAALPSLDELRAKIIGVIQAPASAVARVIRAYSEAA